MNKYMMWKVIGMNAVMKTKTLFFKTEDEATQDLTVPFTNEKS